MARGLTDATTDGSIHEERIPTSKGHILVARQGDVRKPALITYHDLGLNYKTNFTVSKFEMKFAGYLVLLFDSLHKPVLGNFGTRGQ